MSLKLIDQTWVLSWQDKVEKTKEDNLDSIPSPLPSMKIQIIGGKVYLR